MNPRVLIAGFLLFANGPVSAQLPSDDFGRELAAAAQERTTHAVTYDGSYRRIAYPNGDVPDHIGVCTDVVIRSYRSVGIDLQQRVHEDMAAHFGRYPQNWGLSRPDPNIDHRRVLPGNLPHIGIVVEGRSDDDARPLVVHNIGAGPRAEDVLFAYRLTGHYRYSGVPD